MATVSAYLLDDYLMTRIRVPGPAPDHPINMALLIDTSESMDHGRLTAVKQTLHAARPLLRTGDRITLVSFNHEAQLLLDHLELDATGSRLTECYNTVDTLRASGYTNMSAGLETLFRAGTDYDAIVLLTDGHVNCGLSSTAGLRTMALGGVSGRAIHALGYGADHNRGLLRDLATKSAGSYSYVDNDEILPVAIGDIVSGLRTEMLRGVTLELEGSPGAWVSQEAGGWYVGSVVADRDYWVVARRDPTVGLAEPVVAVRLGGGGGGGGPAVEATTPAEDDLDTRAMLREQIMRARAAALLLRISETMENPGARGNTHVNELTDQVAALKTEIQALPLRPLLLRILGQLAEAEELLNSRRGGVERPRSLVADDIPTTPPRIYRQAAATPFADEAHLLARMASGYTVLSQQRGAYSRTAAEDDTPAAAAAASTAIFSSPTQLTSSRNTQTLFESYRPHAPRS